MIKPIFTFYVSLQISRLRINDSGVYQCLVETPEGADYKRITLSVKASYKDVEKHIQKSAEGDGVLLTCQSEGYPESSVVWQDGHMQRIEADTASVLTPEQLFEVTSQIHVRSSDKNNFTCSFAKDGPSATFQIPDEITAPHEKNEALIVILFVAVIGAVTAVAVVMYRRKGCRNTGTSNVLANGGGRDVLPALFLPMEEENEEEKTRINDEGSTKENLEAFAKARYLQLPFTQKSRQYWEAFGVEVLPYRLQNNEGQPVKLQALLPEAGETLLLQGPPESGRTTLAQILVSSWTEGPEHAFPDLLDLSAVRLLLYVDCSKAKGDLFEEIATQLSLTAKMSTDELRTAVLTLSSEALLLLDGYKEGGQVFDESVRKFLSEREGCRVLVMACMGHCESLKDTVGTGWVLSLQTESVTH
ncbi:uncharacterized protein si:ch211-241b2.5 [Xyrichtys novacula]|uniref:Uncharacterized protein si:ch211-241b2.5 n=1 Tax=Xyrichtys novacula TaxID=13765 RepID=A0AAV1GFB0_XYRNO|nr:uncharacterized protein si:ch211-241b2.5 [Xyrichtys novacula]